MAKWKHLLWPLAITMALSACSERSEAPDQAAAAAAAADAPPAGASPVLRNLERNAYFGDLHVHTAYSFDAFIFGTRATPADAYRFAKGEALTHPAGMTMQLAAPLDFQAVTDHAIYLGMVGAMFDADSSVGQHPAAIAIREAKTAEARTAAFQNIIRYLRGEVEDDLWDRAISKDAWDEVIRAAEAHNDPGRFTTFVGYEYTSSGLAFENLHRNVIFKGSQVPAAPFDAGMSRNPEDLWDWMDAERAAGRESLAIPHNSNGSNGWMFRDVAYEGGPMDADYADQRMRNEPIVEITQVKGTSDTHPALSPNDEWANFEIMTVRVASTLASQPEGSYVREAWQNGLIMEQTRGFNPYRFGVIGSSDTHNAAGSFKEYDYWSKTGMLDATPQLRGSVPLDEPGPNGEIYAASRASEWGASGLAGAWAESNTREDIYAAFRRKETFATSGPRMRVRFFAGYGLGADITTRADGIAHAYASGVPMGSDLAVQDGAAPEFFVWATQAADSAPLQRIQVIKGWAENGERREAVYDVACSGGGRPDPVSHRCPDNGARVDLATCAYSLDVGAGELAATWRDPDFDASQTAFYYVRVLENPTCRWSTWDAVRAGVTPREDMPATIQERAWSSPIWVRR